MTPVQSQCPKFLLEIKHQQILIIGNGPSAAEHDLGKHIDTFDQIVRINNYVTSGLETHVGTRTDIWVNGANQGLKKRKDIPDNILVMIPTEVLKHKGEAIHQRIRNRIDTSNYSLLSLETMSEMEVLSSLTRPTTGFFAIYYFYLLGFDITLHGFDFFAGSTSHYFDSALTRWLKDKGLIRKASKHEVNAEKIFIDGLVKAGKIKLLKP